MADTVTTTSWNFSSESLYILPTELKPYKLALVHSILLRCLDVVLCTANCCHVRTGLESEGHVSCAVVLHVVRCPSASIVTTTVWNKT